MRIIHTEIGTITEDENTITSYIEGVGTIIWNKNTNTMHTQWCEDEDQEREAEQRMEREQLAQAY